MLLCLYLPSSNRMLVRFVFFATRLLYILCFLSVILPFLANKRVHNSGLNVSPLLNGYRNGPLSGLA